MAYLDLSTPPFEAPAAPVTTASAPIAEAALTATDQNVISLSLRDPVWSLAPSGRLRRIFNWVFDIRRPNPLSDARLEVLRRFAVLVRRLGDGVEAAETDRLAAAGYSPRLVRDAVWRVASAQASAPIRRQQ